MTEPHCITCGRATACYTTDLDGNQHPLCAECQVRRHADRRFPVTVRTTDGTQALTITTTAGSWGLAFDIRGIDQLAPPTPVIDIASRRNARKA